MPSAGKLVTDKFDEVTIRGKTFSMADVLERLNSLPPISPLSTQEAGIFLGYSVSQMERMRDAGVGPKYEQTPPIPPKPKPGEPAKTPGKNRHVVYRKAALLDWIGENTVDPSMQPQVKRARSFSTLFDLVEEAPFYVDPGRLVESLVEENTLGVVLDRIGEWDIEWLPAIDACRRAWVSIGAHRAFAARLVEGLGQADASIRAGLAATEIRAELSPASDGPRIPPL